MTLTGTQTKDQVQTQNNILAAKQDIAALELKLTERNAEMIKWMFIFWVGQVAVTFGFILLFLKK
ncbi:MAG TPA: hypothetical protein VGN20_00155 [Mucilaginibacter sp.]|jgi:hypothetical protein